MAVVLMGPATQGAAMESVDSKYSKAGRKSEQILLPHCKDEEAEAPRGQLICLLRSGR